MLMSLRSKGATTEMDWWSVFAHHRRLRRQV